MKKRLILSIVESKVNDIIRRQKYLDKLNSEVGFLGTITNTNLFKGSLFKKEANALIKVMDWGDDDDDTFETNHSEVRSNILYKIWDRYAKAMVRRREDSVLGLYPFVEYVALSYYPVYIFKHGRSYIIGQLDKGFFKPSHFAPFNMREGVEAIKELMKFDNIIFAITDDLKDMLIRMGAIYNGMVFPMYFRGGLVNKHILTTDKETLTKIADFLSEKEHVEEKPKSYKEYPESEIFIRRMGNKQKF